MIDWQYLRDQTWVSCSPTNSHLLTARRAEPSMEPLYLINSDGELWGSPENRTMKFRAHHDSIELVSSVRPTPPSDERTLYLAGLNLENPVLLPFYACRKLFEESAEEPRPKWSRTSVTVGTEVYIAWRGQLWTEQHGKMVKLTWKQSIVSKEQFESRTQSRYHWEFNGPFREERMRQAVVMTDAALESSDQRSQRTLRRMFVNFNPDQDVTEHGSSQFNDFLCAHGMDKLACQLMDNYHCIPLNGWQSFDRATNRQIEKFRHHNHSNCIVDIRGRQYMLLFDSGGGGSGQPPILIRPERYSCILNSIEDQVYRAAVKELFGLIDVHSLDIDDIDQTDLFERTLEIAAVATPEERVRIMAAVRRVTHPEDYITTRVQQLMPVLLEKYKEGEIRLSTQEELCPKKLCVKVAATIDTGLSIPSVHRRFCASFKELIQFIEKNQSWVWSDDDRQRTTCDICLDDDAHTLNHCGTAKACLKCWVDSLVRTNMGCPFCRQEVKEGQLKGMTTTPVLQTNTPSAHKKQRTKCFNSVEAVLDRIKQDSRYQSTTLQTTAAARQWFTILVRCKVIEMSQLNKCDDSIHTLGSVIQKFQVL